MNTKLKKVNVGLVFVYAMVPVVLAAVAAVVLDSISGNTTVDTQISIFIMVLLAGCFTTFILIPQVIFSASAKSLRKFCNKNGCQFDYFFYGHTTYVAVDTERRTMGLLFKFNPTSPYVISLDEVSDAKVNNGVGPLTFGTTRRVCFSFHVDGKVLTVFTFDAGVACTLNSRPVMEAIEKAEKMASIINNKYSLEERIFLQMTEMIHS